MPINFYLGGMAATLQWNLKLLDRFALPFSALLVAICALIVVFKFGDIDWFRLVSPLLIWPISAAIVDTPVGRICRRLSPHTFFVFLSHAPVLLAVTLAYNRFSLGLPYEAFWLSAPFLVLLLCLTGKHLGTKYMPKTLAFILGNEAFSFSLFKRTGTDGANASTQSVANNKTNRRIEKPAPIADTLAPVTASGHSKFETRFVNATDAQDYDITAKEILDVAHVQTSFESMLRTKTPELWSTLRSLFLSQASSARTTIRTTLEKNDFVAISIIAHAFVASANMIGLSELATMAESLELAAKGSDPDLIIAQARRFEAAIGLVCDVLERQSVPVATIQARV